MRKSDLPLYRQIASQLGEYIRTGVLPPGSQLPTVRQLANEHNLTRLTVQNAYAELQAEGLVEAVVGRGTFVAQRSAFANSTRATMARPPLTAPPQIPWFSQGVLADMLIMGEQPGLISFAQSSPAPQTFPTAELKRIIGSLLNDPANLIYTSPQGDLSLREEVARLLLDRGIVTSPEQVMITSGAQQGMDLAFKAFSRSDDSVMMEEPTYPGALELVAARQQPVIGIPRNGGKAAIEAGGLDLEMLEQACQLYHPGLLYLIPSFHNPSGLCMSLEQKQRLLELASVYNFLIIEDDTYGFLGLDDRPSPPSLRELDKSGEQVIYLTSFSKCLMPGLRLGVVVAGKAALEQMIVVKRSSDLNTSLLLQRSLAEYLRRYSWGAHLQAVRKIHRESCETMSAALESYLSGYAEWSRPEGGLSFWLTLPQKVNERELYLELINAGVGVAAGGAFFAQPQRQAHLRLSFGPQTPAQIEQGMAILGKVLHQHLARRTQLLSKISYPSSVLV
ncbi:MAG TPA: PLP-dependent aminotransferase family protein [Chloroflexia bacterium]|nr:PLP-dependent aminotransferase family protein [Chloroflexia bacterium]